jgi:hypothetical protein
MARALQRACCYKHEGVMMQHEMFHERTLMNGERQRVLLRLQAE